MEVVIKETETTINKQQLDNLGISFISLNINWEFGIDVLVEEDYTYFII